MTKILCGWMRTSNQRNAKNKLYQEYIKKRRQEIGYCALEESGRNLNDLILQTKTTYYENAERSLIIQHSSQKHTGTY